jgi:hypothetical protein
MLDSDDEWKKDHLKKNLKIALNTDCDGIYGSIILKGTDFERTFHARKLYEGEKMINYLLSSGVGAQTSTLFLKSQAAKEIHWDESLNRHQDYDFVVRFSKRFTWEVNNKATVYYNITNDQKCKVDYYSCIKFINSNKQDILPNIYNDYHLLMYKNALKHEAEKRILLHYKRNAVKYPEFISLVKYLQILNPKNRLQIFFLKLKFIANIF